MQEYTRRLRRERELHSWSQEQVAEKLGTTAPNVSRWERGKTFPDTYYRQKLCELFGKSAEELGLLQNDADEKREQSPNQRAVAQDSHAPALGASLSLRNRNRQRMLQKVRAFWITGVLEQSLHGAALITLGLHEQPDAVANPWELVLQQPDQPAQLLPPGTRITQVYDTMSGELFILGEPGSGKTTLLLELARDLLDRAMQDETHPMPVVFNLASWAAKRQPLADWLVEELSSKYQVPRKLGRSWIDTDQVLPLLDGLDEVALKHREGCVDTINTYRHEHGLVPMVVCSRSADYLAQTARVHLRSAVTIQSLTAQQIDTYLLLAGEKLAVLRRALQVDPMLQELAATPLMLSVLILAYHGKSVEDLLEAESLETHRRQVFATYVQRMLQRRGATTYYTSAQTLRWLSWLAKQLAKQNQTEFYIERMQPDWLADNQLHRFYTRRLARFAVGLVIGLVGGLFLGAICGLVNSLVSILSISSMLLTAGSSGSTIPFIPIIPSVWAVPFMGEVLSSNLRVGMLLGLIVGLLFGLILGLAYKLNSEIKPTEAITWSWTGGWRSVIYGLVGVFVGVLSGLAGWSWLTLVGQVAGALSSTGFSVTVQTNEGPMSEPVSLLIVGLAGGLIGIFVSGLSRNMLDKHTFVSPNQGIWRSARRGVFVGLVSAVIGVLFANLVFALGVGTVSSFSSGFFSSDGSGNVQNSGLFDLFIFVIGDLSIMRELVFGLALGLTFGLFNGGFACIKHVILRVLLWRAKSLPWNYPHFLDYAAKRILLRKVGGGYIFVHRLLLEYFASLDDEQISNEKFRPISKMNT
jgi:eukaryotic-like serine/threonine-protein kinase